MPTCECPTCGKVFDTERGVNLHHSRSHNESLTKVSRECCVCGDEIIRNKSQFDGDSPVCSKSCQYEKMSDAQDKKISLVCDYCDCDFRRRPSVINENKNYCSPDCSHRGRSKKIEAPCTNCGEVVKRSPSAMDSDNIFCSPSCRGVYERRENPTKRRLGNWSKKRRQALSRANSVCEHPNCSRIESKDGSSLQVHHIIPNRFTDKENHNLDNLLVLCREHHNKIEPTHLLQ